MTPPGRHTRREGSPDPITGRGRTPTAVPSNGSVLTRSSEPLRSGFRRVSLPNADWQISCRKGGGLAKGQAGTAYAANFLISMLRPTPCRMLTKVASDGFPFSERAL